MVQMKKDVNFDNGITKWSEDEAITCSIDSNRIMESSELKSPQACKQMETHELSTILVATIQEAKDRISQIEYIFCSQLYPNFHKHSKSLQKIYMEAKSVAQTQFELQIKQLCLEKEQALQECNAFKVDKLRLLTRVLELEDNLVSKEREVDEGMKMHADLLRIIEEKTNNLTGKEQLLKECEERMKILVAKSDELERNLNVLKKQLEGKTEQDSKGKELMKEYQRKIESQELKIKHTELILSENEEEKKHLAMKLENMEASLKSEIRRKVDAENQLRQKDELLSAHEREKQILVSRINHLENKIDKMDTKEAHDDGLSKQIELKNAELVAERQKKRDLSASYRKLKSQYSYLLKKFGLTEDQMKAQEETDQLNHGEKNNTLSVETKKRSASSNGVEFGSMKVKQEMNKCTESSKTAPDRGWRETRTRQSPGGGGLDPHDDFLDTPFENIKGNLNKTTKDMDSDDETQDMRAEFGHKRQQLEAPKCGSKAFKYVETVRKKADRQNLNGIECKQCKKFYDAVLSDGEADKQQNLRCEHHDGVSRHRYRYPPPLTPEGFWNIGFDSQL